jgi:3-oxo-5alpha-steroid 4-dehydrogenase
MSEQPSTTNRPTTEIPAPIQLSEVASFDDTADVIVVGFGGAGACAALEARAEGADVLVVDRFQGGGATAISGGVFYAGGGTRIQRDAKVEDSVDAMFEYLKLEVKGVVSEATLRDFCERSVENLEWLGGHGVPFEGSLCPYKTSYPTDDYYLYYSGNEGFSPFKDAARPAPRGHRAKGKGLPGENFYAPLQKSALEHGVRASYLSRVTRLVVDGEGSVVGVEVQVVEDAFAATMLRGLYRTAMALRNYSPGTSRSCYARIFAIEATKSTRRLFRANRGVVLAAGGFIYNREMVEQHAPKYRPGMPLGTVADDGSGIRLGQSVGGAVDLMDRVSAWRFINPPEAFTRGIVVDKRGERYVNEMMYGAAVGEAMVERHEGKAILILDDAMKREARAQCKPGKAQWFQRAPALLNLWLNRKEAKTIDALAEQIKVPAETLARAVAEYNRGVEEKRDALGKPEIALQKIEKAPFHAIDCSITSKRFPCPTLTLGGLTVDERTGNVVRADESPVRGLYAAGRTAVGVCSRQYVSGLSIADCVYSGRRAGANAARETEAVHAAE